MPAASASEPTNPRTSCGSRYVPSDRALAVTNIRRYLSPALRPGGTGTSAGTTVGYTVNRVHKTARTRHFPIAAPGVRREADEQNDSAFMLLILPGTRLTSRRP